MISQVNKKNAINFLRSTTVKSLASLAILAPIFIGNNSAKAVTLDFEGFSHFETISGDTFSDLGVVFDQDLKIFQGHPAAPIKSGINVAIGTEPLFGDISGFFTEAVDFVSVFAGDNASGDTETVTLLGFDDFDNLVASDTFTDITAQTLSISGLGIVRFEIQDVNQVAIGIDDFTFNPTPKSTPEPASILGLLAFGAMGASSMLKRK
ncbi:PEP-CTERM sorting domain-containing protein [Okeania sp. SIO2C9]|uniref:PEP-CTERM sorting domain-containing protein n=1 Tax=Okeania sp. SIO2C9 TaxID=2607791 RepID=UPI0025F77284|nr:PEP-CTERM sorting domain-containing protein [Okeania sp. SIO2C9]